MYQDCAIEAFIEACRNGLQETRYGDDYVAAVQANLDFWLAVQESRKTNPWSKDAPAEPWGHYVIVHITEHQDECTNIGCIIFDNEGKQVFRRMGPFGRAMYREGLPAVYMRHLEHYGKVYTELADVHRAHESMGHAMSSIKMTAPRATRVSEENFESIYHNFVLALKG